MILKLLAVIFFIILFLVIAFAIIKDLAKERKLIDGREKTRQSYNGYNHADGQKVVHLKNRKRNTNNGSRRDR